MDAAQLESALRRVIDPPSSVCMEALDELTRKDHQVPWNIATTAEHLRVSPHTLRYYERIGLVCIDRDQAGHRRYDPGDVRRLFFLTRMRQSGMSIADLQRYIKMVDAGPETVPERLELMRQHRDALRVKIADLHLALATTEYKLATYAEGPQP